MHASDLPMSDRTAQIDDFLTRMKAALLNCCNEWTEHGESAALRAFVEVLEVATSGLHHLLGEVKLTSEQETEAAKILALKQEIEAASKETVARSKELAELLAKSKGA